MPGSDRKRTVRSCFEAFARDDRSVVEDAFSDDFAFFSPDDPGLDRAGFFERCWPHAGEIGDFSFERISEDGDAVIVTYEARRADKRFRNTEVFLFRDDEICRQEVYYGWTIE